ncbi:MAG: hypothetical protein AB7P04_16080, partial [Bacteriovoracia bacterium]
MAGPRYNPTHRGLLGPFIALKAGYGYASGNRGSFFGEGELYTCQELVLQPEGGYTFLLGRNISATAGAGFMAVVPLATENPVEWSTLGILVHRFVPVVN